MSSGTPKTSSSSSSAINIHLPRPSSSPSIPNPLPGLIQTPSGLALLELQGRINTPDSDTADSTNITTDKATVTELGNISFPEYDPADNNNNSTAWMKRVYMFIGKHQRLSGEVKKLPVPLGIVRRRKKSSEEEVMEEEDGGEDELEMVEIVKHKIVFSQRPEPVTESLYP